MQDERKEPIFVYNLCVPGGPGTGLALRGLSEEDDCRDGDEAPRYKVILIMILRWQL